MPSLTRQLPPSQFDRSSQLTPSGPPRRVLPQAMPAEAAPRLAALELKLQDSLQLGQSGGAAQAETGLSASSNRQLSEALQQLRKLSGSGEQAGALAALQRFQAQTLPANLAALSAQIESLDQQLQALPANSPARETLALQRELSASSLGLYQEAASLLAASPLLQPAPTEAAPLPPAAEPVDSAADAPLEIPSEAELAALAPQLGISGPELRNVFLALENNIEGLNAAGNRIDAAAGKYSRENAGFLRSAGALKTIFKALKGIVSPGSDSKGQPLSGGAAVIARTQSLLSFLMESRRLEQSNPELAGQLKLSRLNQGVDTLIAKLPNQGLQRILTRYVGNSDRASSAAAKQRIADLNTVLGYLASDKPIDLGTSRAIFELVLDNGADAVKGLSELLPPAARTRFDAVVNRIQDRLDALSQRLGSEAPAFLRGLVDSSPEAARQIFRLLSQDGVGRFAASIELVGEFARSEKALKLLGEGGQKNLQALAGFLSLDNLGQGYLRTVLSGDATVPARVNAFNNLAKDFIKDKWPGIKDIELPSLEKIAGQALDRFAGGLGLDAKATAAILQAPEAARPLADGAEAAADRPVAEAAEALAERPGAELPSARPADTAVRPAEAGPAPLKAVDPSPAPSPSASSSPAAGAAPGTTPAAAPGTTPAAAPATAARTAEREAEALLKKFPLPAEAEASLIRLLEQEPAQAEKILNTLGKLGKDSPAKLEAVLRVVAEMEPARALNLVVGEGMGAKLLRSVAELVPALQRYGLSLAQIVPKLGKALGKVIPAAGALVSAYDSARLGQIALTGRSGDRTYADKEVRALALLGASTNALDTLLGVSEAFGVGNVAFPVQAGLAVGSLAIDVLVEYFNDNPGAMPESLRKAIRYTAAATAVAAPFTVPGAGVAATAAITQIYGADGLVDILADLSKDLASGALQGADKLSRLHAKALDQDLAALSGGLRGIADVIRNPDRYAALLGKQASEVLAEATDWLKQQAAKGAEAAREVFAALADVANHPGAYAEAARDRILELASDIGQGVSAAAGAARDFIVAGVQQGWTSLKAGADRLLELGAEGLRAAAELGGKLLKAGGEAAQQFYDFARDVAQDPGKYGQLIAAGVSNALSAGWQATRETAGMLANLARQGIASAGQALSDLVAAGGEAALEGLRMLRDAPAAVAAAIGNGLNKALEVGKASLEMLQFVIDNPAAAAAAVGDKAVELFTRSRDWLKERLVSAKEGVVETFEAIEKLYANTKEYLGDLGDRVGAALGRFEDTVVDIVGQGIDVGKAALQRYGEVLSRRLPELLAAWQDLQQAPIDLMVRIGKSGLEAGAQVAEYLANKASELGSQALDGLRDLGAEGLKQLSNLAEAGGELASQAVDKISEMGAAGYRELRRLASAGGAIAKRAFDEIAAAAKKGVDSARAALSELAGEAGEIARQAVDKLGDLGQWGADQLKSLVSEGKALAREAITQLSEMGSRGLEALEALAKAGGTYAREAFNSLARMGPAAIAQLRDLVTSSSAYAREAFDSLVAQGAKAIDALRDIGTQVEAYAGDAIQALGRIGGAAEDAIRKIGERFSSQADEALTALKNLGTSAIDSIQALAGKYTHLRDDAIRALSGMGGAASAAINRLVDDLWASGQAGVATLMNMSAEIGAVSSRVYGLVRNTLADGWNRSTIDLNPFNSIDTNLQPLKQAVRQLLNQAMSAGRQAYQQAREMAFRALRELGVPDFAIRLLQEVT